MSEVWYNRLMVIRHRVTVAQYLALPEEPPYFEYLDGEVIEKAMPNRDQGVIAEELALHLGPYRRRVGGISGPELRVVFEDAGQTAYRLPDYAYWAPGKPQGGPAVMLPPTLAVEIRSPDEAVARLREKCRYYRAHGVAVAWLIDPVARRVEVFDGARDGLVVHGEASLESPSLPGFRLALADLFAVLDAPDS